ncbi:MAG TPA: branched-chain amino acid ABC transporter ATP-binding protein/permease [Candidatus Dormibacteraeota bacterium]
MSRLRRLGGRRSVVLAAVLAVALFPQVVDNRYYLFLGSTLALYVLVATGMNVLAGFTGQYSIAQGALGAYTAANLTVLHGWSLWPAAVASLAVPAVAAAVLSLPSVRLSRWYFAMITVLIASLVQQFLLQARDLTGGGGGLAGIPGLGPGGQAPDPIVTFYVLALIDGVAIWASWNLLRSPWGRAMMAVRDADVAAQASGVSLPAAKLLAFVLSALAAGLMGVLYASLNGAVAPDLFSLDLGILILLMIVVGGAGLIEAPLLGPLALFALPTLLFGLARYRLFVYGVLLLLVMAFAPAGLGGGIRALLARRRPPPRLEAAPARPALPAAVARDGLALETRGLRRGFGGVLALDGVDLRVEAGTVQGIIGPNGSGKTTLLNTISGFYPPEAGRVLVGGRDVTGWPPHRLPRAGVARTFQQPRALPDESALVNVLLGAFSVRRATLPEWMLRVGRARAEDRRLRAAAVELLAFVGLSGLEDAPAGLLPHGQLRLLEIARALAARPAVLLLDEPAAGLGPEELDRLAALVRSLRDARLTVLLVEHHIDFLTDLADRLAVMNAGRLLAQAAPAEALSEPEVVAAYLGAAARTV